MAISSERRVTFSHMAVPSADSIIIDTSYYGLLRSGYLPGTINTREWSEKIRGDIRDIIGVYRETYRNNGCEVFHYDGFGGSGKLTALGTDWQRILIIFADSEKELGIFSRILTSLFENKPNESAARNLVNVGDFACSNVGVLVIGYGHGKYIADEIKGEKQ